jgi:hypothetical protein
MPVDSAQYFAFISYSHRDSAWADWLHKGIELADGSLFIATSLGNIYQLPPNSTGYGGQILYASGQSGIKQIRAGVNQQNLYVFATLQNGGANSVAEFGGPAPSLPFTAPVASATVGGAPVGLSVH